MRITIRFIAVALITVSGGALAEGDPAMGKDKSTACAACHGEEGISSIDFWPNLAGQKYAYLIKQMQAFRDGTREEPTMTPIAQQLSEQDVMDLSAFYSSLEP